MSFQVSFFLSMWIFCQQALGVFSNDMTLQYCINAYIFEKLSLFQFHFLVSFERTLSYIGYISCCDTSCWHLITKRSVTFLLILLFKDLILHEQLGMEIAYFDRFQDALRPVHCAIMLRNVKILRALTERNLQFDQIQATCDRRNEKNFQKELLRLVSLPKISKFSIFLF